MRPMFCRSITACEIGPMAIMAGASLVGVGLQAAQAFSGSSGGGSPTTDIPLSPESRKVEKSLFDETKAGYERSQKGQFLPNIVEPFIRNMRLAEEDKTRAIQSQLSTAVGRESQGEVLGTGRIAEGILGGGISGITGIIAEGTSVAEAQRQNFISSLNQLANIRNIELQTPVLEASADITRNQIGQLQSINQGRAIGDIASMGGMLTFGGKIMGS